MTRCMTEGVAMRKRLPAETFKSLCTKVGEAENIYQTYLTCIPTSYYESQ